MKRCVATGKRTPDGWWVLRTATSTFIVRPEGLPKQQQNAVLD